MATTNAKLYNRMDSLQNWTTTNPMLEPKEAAYIEGSNTYVVNNTGTSATFNDLYGYGTANAGKTSSCYVCAYVAPSSSPNNGTTTLRRRITGGYENISGGTWSANQSSNNNVDLPNFIADATVDFPKQKVNNFIDVAFKSPAGTPVDQLMPNCMPIDLVVVALREIFARIGTIKNNEGQNIDTVDLAQRGLQAAMELLPYKVNS